MAFVTIVAAKQMEKGGDIIAKVIAVGDITEGKGDKGPWRKQEATLKDNSGEVKLTMWNDDVGGIDQGQHYKFEGLFWKLYKEELVPQIGKFTKLSLASAENMLEVTEAEREATPEPTNRCDPKIPDLETSLKAIVHTKTMELLMIEKEVRATLQANNPREAENGQKIGMFTRTIFNFLNEKGMSDY